MSQLAMLAQFLYQQLATDVSIVFVYMEFHIITSSVHFVAMYICLPCMIQVNYQIPQLTHGRIQLKLHTSVKDKPHLEHHHYPFQSHIVSYQQSSTEDLQYYHSWSVAARILLGDQLYYMMMLSQKCVLLFVYVAYIVVQAQFSHNLHL